MRALQILSILAVISVLGFAILPVTGQSVADVPHGPVHWLADHDWSGQFCRYPGPNYKRTSTSTSATIRTTRVMENEPNDLPANAQDIDISPGPVDPVDVDVQGTINIGADVDRYRITVTKGDIYGLAVVGSGSLDSVVAIEQNSGSILIENDNDGGLTYIYPPQSPFPGGASIYDSSLTWIAPADGDYLIRVSSFASASRGDYTLKIRARRTSFESQTVGTTQVIFVDFDGATINAQEIFRLYFARTTAILSPLRYFLTDWGLSAEDEADVVEAIITNVEDRFNFLRQASLNGNLDNDKVLGHYDVQILNSRDHADPWGQPNVSRVIVGGTIDQSGIPTLGIASTIDPGNFSREDTALVLLDLFSAPKGNPNSVNSIGLASGYTILDAIGATVGNVVVHEAGHYLGNWHTDNANDIPCIMDQGGVYVWILAGAGKDGILGTGDDEPRDFVADAFIPNEAIAIGDERTDVNTAFALATGRVEREETPTTPPLPYPQASVRATPTSGKPPLTVQFAAGAIDDTSNVSYTWDFADGSPMATGPIVTHEFSIPGTFLVRVTATNSLNSTGFATVLITVNAEAPTAVIVATPKSGAAPLTVHFDGSTSETANDTITAVSYEWDFGDGTTSTEAVVNHTYTQAGYYAARLKFTDSNGSSSIANVLITVSPATSVTNTDSAQETPTTSTVAPKCGLGGGVMMIGSLAGLCVMMLVRRRY